MQQLKASFNHFNLVWTRRAAYIRLARRKWRPLRARIEIHMRALYERAVAAMPPWNKTDRSAGRLRGSEALAQVKRSLRRPFAAALLFSVVMNLLALTTPIYMSQIYDRVLSAYSAETLAMLTIITLGLLVLFVAVDHARNRVLTLAALKTEQDLGSALLAASVRDQLAGRTDASLPLRDLAALRSLATSPLMAVVFDAPLAPLYVLILFLIHWALGVATLVGALVMFGLASANQHATQKRVEAAGRAANNLMLSADLQMRNAETVEAMGLMHDLEERWNLAQDRVLAAQYSAHRTGSLFQCATRYMRLALQVIALGLGAALVLGGALTPGMMIAASIILGRALQPIEIAVGSWRTLVTAKNHYERIRNALNRSNVRTEVMALPPPEGRITLEQVYVLSGPERTPVLRGISFALSPGESLGIIGPAASGKSTLARTLLGIQASSGGKVRLDGNDIGKWPRSELGRHIGYLPQDVELFPATVAQNIARMGTVDSRTVIAAARLAGVHEMIQMLPDGYDTRIMAGGVMLSPGQRQRLALARAVHGAPKLIVLDEPNANLDGEGEEALENALKIIKSKKITVVVIAHRFGVLRNVEKVLLLREGAVQALGPRDEMLARLARRSGGHTQTGGVVPLLNLVPAPGVLT